MAKDYYRILAISKGATQEEIKKAYRKMAMEFHPDRNPGKEKWANEKFKEINEAFSVLGDPEKRHRYDQFGRAEGINIGDIFRSSSTRGGFEDLMKDFGGAGLRFDFLDDIFSDFPGGQGFSFKKFGGSGSIRFETWPRGGIDPEQIFGQTQRAQPVRYELILNAEEARRGTKKYLSRNGKRLEVKIPTRVKTGNIVKLSNALNLTDGHPGDILIQIKVR